MNLTYKQIKKEKQEQIIIRLFGSKSTQELKKIDKTCKSLHRWIKNELRGRKQEKDVIVAEHILTENEKQLLKKMPKQYTIIGDDTNDIFNPFTKG